MPPAPPPRLTAQVNAHPHVSGPDNAFVVIHNGIITNNKEIKTLLQSKVWCAVLHAPLPPRQGYVFVSETDTECIALLIKYIYDTETARAAQSAPHLTLRRSLGTRRRLSGWWRRRCRSSTARLRSSSSRASTPTRHAALIRAAV